MKVIKDFNHLGAEYKGGQDVKPSAFSAADVQGLINKGLIAEDKQKDLEPPKASKRSNKK